MEDGSSDVRRRRYWLGLAVLLLAAAASRIFRLTVWPLSGDEFFTLRDSTRTFTFSLHNRPLLFWLNHVLVQPLVGLDVFGLRLLPAAFGIAGVGVVTEAGRRLVSARAGLVAGALALVSPWHLAMSQFARYYTLVFLLATVAPAALYLGVRERSRGWLAAGAAAVVLAWFAHPTAVLPTAGFVVWLTGDVVVRADGRRRRRLLGIIGFAGAVGIALGAQLLSGWTALGQEWGIGGFSVGASYAMRLGAGATLAAAAGAVLLWLDRRGETALFLAAAVGVPLVVVAVLGLFVAVHTGYLFATAPYALVAAGAFVDRTARRFGGAGRLAVGATLLALVAAPGLPSFVSHYVDGSRPDFRAAAWHVAERAGQTDLVVTDSKGPFNVHAPTVASRFLPRDTARLAALVDSLSRVVPPGELWVVPVRRSEGGFGLTGLGPIREWVWHHCRLSARIDPVRIDYVRNIVEVWRCSGEGGA